MPKTIRTFIAVPLPDGVLARLAALQDELKSMGFRFKWMQTKNIHLTLKFLGDIPENDVEQIGEVVKTTAEGVSPISLKSKAIGVFPGIRNVRVVWAGLSGETHALIELQKKLEENMDGIGYPKETRPFRAHLTIARSKFSPDPKMMAEAIETFSAFETGPFTADRLILYKSDLKPGGAVYTRLCDAPFV